MKKLQRKSLERQRAIEDHFRLGEIPMTILMISHHMILFQMLVI